jgi:chromosome segregation ATPase
MKSITMLTAMAGADFSYDPGQVIEIADPIAEAWIEAGLAELAQPLAKLNGQIKTLKAQLADKADQVEGLVAQVAAAQAVGQTATAIQDQLTQDLESAQGAASQYQALLEACQKALAETQGQLAERSQALEAAEADLETAQAAHQASQSALAETEDRLTAAMTRALAAEQVVANVEADAAASGATD